MAFIIDSAVLSALEGSKSVRVKCLHELETVLNNNITFENGENDQNELKVIHFSNLIKKLILWFNFKEFPEEIRVLSLILRLVKVFAIFYYFYNNII